MKELFSQERRNSPEGQEAEGKRWFGRSILDRFLRREQTAYSNLDESLKTLDKSTPSFVADYHPETGDRYNREREFNPKATKRMIIATFEGQFASKKDTLIHATDELLSTFAMEDVRDTVPLGQVDRFLAHYPHNVAEGLGYSATAENMHAVLETGSRLLQVSAEKERVSKLLYDKGTVADLLGTSIPRLVALNGADCLEEIVAIATEHGIDGARSFVNFNLQYDSGLPEVPFTAQDIVGIPAPESPFTHEDLTEAWKELGWMGAQQRSPEWSDLAGMAAITDQWKREYGLTIRKDEAGEVAMGFKRGSEGSISNRHELEKDGEILFFHSHPSEGTGDGLLAPLVSPFDVSNTFDQDHGGAYLNVVCRDGVTLYLGSKEIDQDGVREGWRVESGIHEGMTITPNGIGDQMALDAMQKLHDTEALYTYSITMDSVTPRKLEFVHVPWSYLARIDVDLQDVCFGEGLQRLISTEVALQDNEATSLHGSLERLH